MIRVGVQGADSHTLGLGFVHEESYYLGYLATIEMIQAGGSLNDGGCAPINPHMLILGKFLPPNPNPCPPSLHNFRLASTPPSGLSSQPPGWFMIRGHLGNGQYAFFVHPGRYHSPFSQWGPGFQSPITMRWYGPSYNMGLLTHPGGLFPKSQKGFNSRSPRIKPSLAPYPGYEITGDWCA